MELVLFFPWHVMPQKHEREKKTEKTHWKMCYRSRLIKKWFVCSELHLLFVELVFQLVFAFSTFCIIRWAKNDFVVDQMFELHAFLRNSFEECLPLTRHPKIFHDGCTHKFFFKQRIDGMMKIQKSFGKNKPLLPWNLHDAKNDAKNFKYHCKGIVSLCV